MTAKAIPSDRVHLTRRRLPKPSAIPAVEQAAAFEWAAGWWAGIVVGGTTGFALAVIVGLAR
jgi:hypothetical protein